MSAVGLSAIYFISVSYCMLLIAAIYVALRRTEREAVFLNFMSGVV